VAKSGALGNTNRRSYNTFLDATPIRVREAHGSREMTTTKLRMASCALAMLFSSVMAFAAPKTASNGETCIISGEKRRSGEDSVTKEKLDCLWDYCTYCGTSGGKIDCSILKTEYSNARDCKPAASRAPRTNVIPEAVNPGVLDPGTPPPKWRPLEQAIPPAGVIQE
jgi:hypothetical protein